MQVSGNDAGACHIHHIREGCRISRVICAAEVASAKRTGNAFSMGLPPSVLRGKRLIGKGHGASGGSRLCSKEDSYSTSWGPRRCSRTKPPFLAGICLWPRLSFWFDPSSSARLLERH